MIYKDYFVEVLLSRVKMLNCLKILACYTVNKVHSYDVLLRLANLETDELDEVLGRLVKRGMLTKLGSLYQLGGNRSSNPNDSVFDICKKFNCMCRALYYQTSQKDNLQSIMEGKGGWSKIKQGKSGKYISLLSLFYTLTGGKSPNIKRELFCLRNLSKDYSLNEIETAIRYAASKQKIYTLNLLPYLMNEALAKSDIKTKIETKPLSKLERVQLCYEVLGESGVKKQFSEEVLKKFLALLNSGKVHLGLKERLNQKPVD